MLEIPLKFENSLKILVLLLLILFSYNIVTINIIVFIIVIVAITIATNYIFLCEIILYFIYNLRY